MSIAIRGERETLSRVNSIDKLKSRILATINHPQETTVTPEVRPTLVESWNEFPLNPNLLAQQENLATIPVHSWITSRSDGKNFTEYWLNPEIWSPALEGLATSLERFQDGGNITGILLISHEINYQSSGSNGTHNVGSEVIGFRFLAHDNQGHVYPSEANFFINNKTGRLEKVTFEGRDPLHGGALFHCQTVAELYPIDHESYPNNHTEALIARLLSEAA